MEKSKLYIDESGNTGGILYKNFQFTFNEQPYYSLAGILLIDKEKESAFEVFINSKKKSYGIVSDELKARNIYNHKPWFIIDIVDYIIQNKLPFFIELMDKSFYLNIQVVECFILPSNIIPVNDETIRTKSYIASNIGSYLNQSIYETFIQACVNYSSEALENFYIILKNHFISIGETEFAECVKMTEATYFDLKRKNKELALKEFLPLPDKNSNNKYIHLLPNFNAFTGLIARAQKFKNLTNIPAIDIIHDEQKQFDEIFQTAFNSMKKLDSSQYTTNTFIENMATHYIEEDFSLSFIDSKENTLIQIADILAGFVSRFWNDFIGGKIKKVELYKPVMEKLRYPYRDVNIGINFVVPDQEYAEISSYLSRQ